MAAKPKRNRFLLRTKEDADFNQYWYSAATIKALAEEVELAGGCCAFLSTPSVYFSVDKEPRASCKVFDYDRQWEKDPGFVFYDFNKPEEIPKELHHTFKMIVIDPPFITREVWEKYTEAARLLLTEGSVPATSGGDESKADAGADDAGDSTPEPARIIASTIAENKDLMAELLAVKPVAFKPSIPNLVYQYNFYTNFEATSLGVRNPEIPEDDDYA